MRFDDPWFLSLLLLLPLYYRYAGRRPVLRYPSLKTVKSIPVPLKARLGRLPEVMKTAALAFLVIALARPQLANSEKEVTTRGSDIILALDMSGSMRAEDFRPKNRFFVAREVIKDFIKGRYGDRIGLIVFAGKSYTQAPLTLDYGILLQILEGLELGRIPDGTAIGMALAEGVKRLKDSEAETKIIILLTDGVNNAGNIDPVTAARAAQALGVKVYTVGVGKEGGAPIPVYSPIYGEVYARDSSGNIILTEMNEEVLKEVAEITGAKYFRATDAGSLGEIYREIDAMEKSDIKFTEYRTYSELYPYPLLAAVALLLLSFLLRATWLWSYP